MSEPKGKKQIPKDSTGSHGSEMAHDDSLRDFLEMEEFCRTQTINTQSADTSNCLNVIPKICVNDVTVVTMSPFAADISAATNKNQLAHSLNETMMISSDSDTDESEDEPDTFNDTIEQFDYIVKRANRSNRANGPIEPMISDYRLKLLQQHAERNKWNKCVYLFIDIAILYENSIWLIRYFDCEVNFNWIRVCVYFCFYSLDQSRYTYYINSKIKMASLWINR